MEPELYIFLTAVVGLATAIVVLAGLVWKVRQDVKGVGRNVNAVRVEFNGRMDEHLALARKAAYAAGVVEGQDRPSSRE